MKRSTAFVFTILIVLVSVISYAYSWDHSRPLIIDHNYTDLNLISADRIDSVKLYQKLHYAHTSHGGQINYGLGLVPSEYPDCRASVGGGYLPTDADRLCIFDGQIGSSYITPDLYWETETGLNATRAVLNNNPTINASIWCWCTQVDYYTEIQVQAYFDAISLLEAEYTDVVFVYMTGNAQATGSSGYNRYLRNEQIRQFCRDNNKVLYDFADLDSWWFNPVTQGWEYSTYEYNGYTVPVEHPQFLSEEFSHTTAESCLQKGKAFWWLVSLLEGGGQGDTLSVDETTWGEIKNLYR